MKRIPSLAICCAIVTSVPVNLFAQIQRIPPESSASAPAGASYAETARRVLAAPLVIDATIKDATKIKGAEAAGIEAGRTRFYVEADVSALIRGTSAMPGTIGYVVDVAPDARGRVPKLRKQRVLLFARPVAGQPAMVQLIGVDSQRLWTPAEDALVRKVVQELVASNAPPEITGLGNAFHVPGTLPGEGETQIFVTTASGAPVSLQILRRPGEQPRWTVALGEIVDEGAGPPQRDTLLWYRLACGLPRTLPDSSVANETPENAAAAREDYQLVLDALGKCA